jgi:naphthalene 1,2-dioxygenase system ferredoxin subunit
VNKEIAGNTKPPDSEWIAICPALELPDGTLRGANINGVELVLVNAAGDFYALTGLCPHDHARLCDGFVDEGKLVCPRHQARFNLHDGSALPGFANLPALTLYPVRVVADTIEIDASRLQPKPKTRWDLT